MFTLNLSQAYQLAEQAVKERGESFIYRPAQRQISAGMYTGNCAYFHDDGPGCIVGYMMHLMGFNLKQLRACAIDPGAVNGSSIGTVHAMVGAHLTPEALSFLAVLQARQDDGWPWGEAFRNAVEHVSGEFKGVVWNKDTPIEMPNAKKDVAYAGELLKIPAEFVAEEKPVVKVKELHILSAPVAVMESVTSCISKLTTV